MAFSILSDGRVIDRSHQYASREGFYGKETVDSIGAKIDIHLNETTVTGTLKTLGRATLQKAACLGPVEIHEGLTATHTQFFENITLLGGSADLNHCFIEGEITTPKDLAFRDCTVNGDIFANEISIVSSTIDGTVSFSPKEHAAISNSKINKLFIETVATFGKLIPTQFQPNTIRMKESGYKVNGMVFRYRAGFGTFWNDDGNIYIFEKCKIEERVKNGRVDRFPNPFVMFKQADTVNRFTGLDIVVESNGNSKAFSCNKQTIILRDAAKVERIEFQSGVGKVIIEDPSIQEPVVTGGVIERVNRSASNPSPARGEPEKQEEEKADICAITLESILDLAKKGELSQTKCGHKFSTPDISEWVKKHGKCPTCKESLKITDITEVVVSKRYKSS